MSSEPVLYVAATPIGNLDDVTPRLLETIGSVALVACEDTRVFGRLCARHSVSRPSLKAYHEHNERQLAARVLEVLSAGDSVLLVSNAGTPLISDPGYKLVRAAIDNGIRVSPLPGPNAAIAALSASGLRVDRFAFVGFPPKKPGKLRNFLVRYKLFDGTLIFYESPHRVAKLTEACREVFGNCPAVVARELTKMHEQFLRYDLDSLIRYLAAHKVRGECSLLVQNDVEPD
ncbi:MAG: 16S rRNA (cytidine(1402)-2'-O)-methyltransferase [Planctomycetota bacterium]|nr:16S rRNA (cytidine(1402)-2'-O)-methyltransferase [Planctomycetota bacterium]